MSTARAIPGLYAAGELVGGLFYFNYPGGSGPDGGGGVRSHRRAVGGAAGVASAVQPC